MQGLKLDFVAASTMFHPPTDVLVLLDTNDRRAERENYLIWALCEAWRDLGLRVAVARGPGQARPARLLFPHVDRTVTPADVVRLYERYPLVVNRGVHDISKRHVSRLLVGAGDSWTGPVIVKTDLNAGGAPERRLSGAGFDSTFRSLARRLVPARVRQRARRRVVAGPPDLGSVTALPPDRYPVFPSLADVPRAAFANPALVVERFLPETEDGLYAVRSWVFLGPRGHATRRLSPRPVVRADAVVRREPISVPRDIEEDRARLAFDYGKLDFVLHGDRAILLDANRTPKLSGSSPSADALAKARNLALGVAAWLDSPEGRPLGGEPPPGREEKRRR